MAVRFHPLPVDVFSDAARPHIVRLNYELRDLFALEGTLNDPRQVRRSDQTVVRQESTLVDITRVSSSPSSSVLDASIFATPSIGYATAFSAGSAATTLRSNATLRFPTSLMVSGSTYTISTQGGTDSGRGFSRELVWNPTGTTTVSGTIRWFREDGDASQGPRVVSRGAFWALPDDGTTDAFFCRAFDNSRSSFEIEGALTGPGTGRVAGLVTWGVSGTPAGYEPGLKWAINARGTFEFYRSDSSMIEFRPLNDNNVTTTAATRLVDSAGNNVWALRRDGLIEWGAVGGAGTDTFLGRSFAGWLRTPHIFGASSFSAVGSSTQTLVLSGIASAVNYIELENAIASGVPEIRSRGSDASIGLLLDPKGNGFVTLSGPVSITGTAAANTSALDITQPNTGSAAGEHITLSNKAGDPPAPVTGGLWRNADALNFRTSTATINLAAVTAFATPALTLGTANAAGSATTVIRSDATLLAFDTTVPAALAATAAVGTATVAARRDHVHLFPPTLRTTDASPSTLTLTDDNTDQTLAGSLGILRIDTAGLGVRFLEGIAIGADPISIASANVLRSVTSTGDDDFGLNFSISHSVTSAARTASSQGIVGQLEILDTHTKNISGQLTCFSGTFSSISGGGILSDIALFRASYIDFAAAGSVVDAYAFVNEGAAITVAHTNLYGFRHKGWGGGTNPWAFYADADKSYFGGDVRLPDGIATVYGTGLDAHIYWDNPLSRLIIDSHLLGVGTGKTHHRGPLVLIPASGAGNEVHLEFDDKAANPGTPTTGMLWRNGNALNFRKSTGTVDLASGAGGVTNPMTADLNTGGFIIDDTNGNEQLSFGAAASAVNYPILRNAAAGNDPVLEAGGDETNINLNLVSKGTGIVTKNGIEVVGRTGAQQLEDKTLTTFTIPNASNIVLQTGTGTKIGTGTTQKLAFHGSTPVAQETVTGSRVSGAALADLLTKLATKGLIVDGTSA